jgi:hypothetical protein
VYYPPRVIISRQQGFDKPVFSSLSRLNFAGSVAFAAW